MANPQTQSVNVGCFGCLSLILAIGILIFFLSHGAEFADLVLAWMRSNIAG